jgi:hypothetical protein
MRPVLDLLRMTFINENNILHHFATNEHFLRFYLKEVKVLVSEIEDDDAQRYCYFVLFSNCLHSKTGRRPFTISLKGNAPKCLEIMIELLSLDPSQDYMRYISNNLEQLLLLKSNVFYRFFESNCSKTLQRIPVYAQFKTNYDRI